MIMNDPHKAMLTAAAQKTLEMLEQMPSLSRCACDENCDCPGVPLIKCDCDVCWGVKESNDDKQHDLDPDDLSGNYIRHK